MVSDDFNSIGVQYDSKGINQIKIPVADHNISEIHHTAEAVKTDPLILYRIREWNWKMYCPCFVPSRVTFEHNIKQDSPYSLTSYKKIIHVKKMKITTFNLIFSNQKSQ